MTSGPAHSEHTDVGAYALGLLEQAERQAFEEHLATCPSCAAELAELSAMKDLLTGIGPVPAATEEPTEAEVVDLVRRRAADQRRRTRWRVALSAAAAVVLLAGGVAVGLATAPKTPQPPPSALQGKIFSATSAATHVTGKVGLVAKTWGTMVTLQLYGVAGPLDCQVVAVSSTGQRQVLGSWLVPAHAHFGLPGHPKPLVVGGPSGIKINDLSRIVIDVVNGRTLVSIPTTAA